MNREYLAIAVALIVLSLLILFIRKKKEGYTPPFLVDSTYVPYNHATQPYNSFTFINQTRVRVTKSSGVSPMLETSYTFVKDTLNISRIGRYKIVNYEIVDITGKHKYHPIGNDTGYWYNNQLFLGDQFNGFKSVYVKDSLATFKRPNGTSIVTHVYLAPEYFIANGMKFTYNQEEGVNIENGPKWAGPGTFKKKENETIQGYDVSWSSAPFAGNYYDAAFACLNTPGCNVFCFDRKRNRYWLKNIDHEFSKETTMNNDIDIYHKDVDLARSTTFRINKPGVSAPDPCVALIDGKYYMLNSAIDGIHVSSSATFEEGVFDSGQTVLTACQIKKYHNIANFKSLFAPDIAKIGSNVFIFYSFTTTNNDLDSKIYYVPFNTATNQVSFTGSPNPIMSRGIDPNIAFINGKYYMTFSNTQGTQLISISELRVNGNDISVVRTVNLSRPSMPWETSAGVPVNEGPSWFTSPNGIHFLVFSAAFSNTPEYCLSYFYLRKDSDPMIPSNWIKSKTPVTFSNPRTHPNNKLFGPGHGVVIKTTEGRYFNVFHASTSKNTQYQINGVPQRMPFAQEFFFDGDMPTFGNMLIASGTDLTPGKIPTITETC